jgi:hypothetical protein
VNWSLDWSEFDARSANADTSRDEIERFRGELPSAYELTERQVRDASSDLAAAAVSARAVRFSFLKTVRKLWVSRYLKWALLMLLRLAVLLVLLARFVGRSVMWPVRAMTRNRKRGEKGE